MNVVDIIEECALACDREADSWEHLDRNGRSRYIDDAAVARDCARAIRRLKLQYANYKAVVPDAVIYKQIALNYEKSVNDPQTAT